ncbi:MAG: peptidylprolyl isomerase [Actinomycetota bacterium]
MPRSTRHRQLARLAARRQAEKRRRQRQRTAAIAVATVTALVGGLVVFVAFTGGSEPGPGATGTPTPSIGPTPPASPGERTGMVEPSPGPDTVACGADEPPGADEPKPQFAGPPPMEIDRKKIYTATIDTSCGPIVVRLLADRAPQTVNSFVFLAQKGYFDGIRFHRIATDINVIQGGDPTGTGSGGPGYSIPDELTGDESYGPGVLALANAGSDTGGSQFFVIYGKDGHDLDAAPNYTIFGEVVEGLEVARRIASIPIQDPEAAATGDLSAQQPTRAIYIERVTIADSK